MALDFARLGTPTPLFQIKKKFGKNNLVGADDENAGTVEGPRWAEYGVFVVICLMKGCILYAHIRAYTNTHIV